MTGFLNKFVYLSCIYQLLLFRYLNRFCSSKNLILHTHYAKDAIEIDLVNIGATGTFYFFVTRMLSTWCMGRDKILNLYSFLSLCK